MSTSAEDRKRNAAVIALKFENIGRAIESAAKVKETNRQKVAVIGNETGTFLESVIKAKLNDVNAEYHAQMERFYLDIAGQLEALRTMLLNRDAVLDLSSMELANALSLINLAGPALTFDQAKMINENFAGNQTSLRVIKTAYEAKSVASDGGIGNMIYDVNTVFDGLSEYARGSLLMDGSLNDFASYLAKVAALEGVGLDAVNKMPDEHGYLMNMRAAAGLDPIPATK